MFGEEGFGMELNAFERKRLVSHAEDDPVAVGRTDLKNIWHLDGSKRVVANGFELLRHIAENSAAIVMNRRQLAVCRFDPSDRPSKGRHDALHPQANSEDRRHTCRQEFMTHSEVGRIVRMSRAWRQHHMTECVQIVDVYFIVFDDRRNDIGDRRDQVSEIPGEGIVVIHEYNPRTLNHELNRLARQRAVAIAELMQERMGRGEHNLADRRHSAHTATSVEVKATVERR